MGLGEAPFFGFSDLLSISPSSFTTDISKHIPINVCAVASEPTFQESSLAQASVKWPWVGLVQRGDSGRMQTLTFPESLFSYPPDIFDSSVFGVTVIRGLACTLRPPPTLPILLALGYLQVAHLGPTPVITFLWPSKYVGHQDHPKLSS